MTRGMVLVVGILAICPGALGANRIREWSGYYVLDVDYTVAQDLREVVIRANSNPDIPWRFEAFDDVTHEPGDNNDIRIERTGPLGVVRLRIEGDPGQQHTRGAANVKRIDLMTNADAQNTVEFLDITQDFGALGPMLAHNAGRLTIDGSVWSDIDIQDNITDAVLIEGSLGADIACDSLQDLTVLAGTVGEPLPKITVRNGYDSLMVVNGSLRSLSIGSPGLSGSIHVYGDLACDLPQCDSQIVGDLSGWLEVTGNLGDGTPQRQLEVTGAVTPYGDLEVLGDVRTTLKVGSIGRYEFAVGEVHVGGNLAGTIWVTNAVAGKLEIAGHVVAPSVVTFKDLSWFGEVRVGGSVDPNAVIEARDSEYYGTIAIGQDLRGLITFHGPLYIVTVNGSFGATGVIRCDTMYGIGAVAVDFDGWNLGHDWEDGAYVWIEYDPIQRYEGNTPSRHIWQIQCSKGDMNGDGKLNNFDIDPFVLALTNEEGYKDAFPGLDGSRIYHGNCDCSDRFDNFDIDPFVLRLTNPCAYKRQFPDCDPCLAPCPPGEGGEGGLDAQAVADLYKQNVAPERLPYVIDAAEFLSGYYRGAPRGKFWTEVYAVLVK